MEDTYYVIGYDRADAFGTSVYPRYEDAARLSAGDLTIFSVPVTIDVDWESMEEVD